MDRLPDIRMATQNSRVKNHAVTTMGLKNTNITKLSRELISIRIPKSSTDIRKEGKREQKDVSYLNARGTNTATNRKWAL